MTADTLRGFRNKTPFKPFAIHMTGGNEFVIKDPEDLFIHPDWSADAMVLHPRGRFSFIYLKNVASVSSEGAWPKMKRRRRGGSGSGEA